MLTTVEQTRLRVSKKTEAKKKSQLGQFFTPAKTAAFMAGLFPPASGDCRLLDAGAGIGSLSAAFLERWISGDFQFHRMELDVFEVDDSLHPYLNQTLARHGAHPDFSLKIRGTDFVHATVNSLSRTLFAEALPRYTHAILNPPYKKITSNSAHRRALRHLGIETVNLYSAFVALALTLMASGGQIVAIIPRSFCNGPYYRTFRDYIFQHTAIRHIHLFASRSKAFKDDDVLQENIIIRLERAGQQGPVTVSTSTDDTFMDLIAHDYPFDQIVSMDAPERFIHIPTSPGANIEVSQAIRSSLTDLGLTVSTGPVVDFRLKAHLRDTPEDGTVPLLYPAHFNSGALLWPIAGMKKPNAIHRNNETEKWLFPNGFYCVVRRFSSKEEKRRIVANVVAPATFDNAPLLGFENHLNLFHDNKHGLPEKLARGLAAYLNSTVVDDNFRRFSGHTQVNATDLRLMKYPSREILMEIGAWAMRQKELTQTMIDGMIDTITT